MKTGGDVVLVAPSELPTGYVTWVAGRSVLDLKPALLPQALVNVIAGAASTARVSASLGPLEGHRHPQGRVTCAYKTEAAL